MRRRCGEEQSMMRSLNMMRRMGRQASSRVALHRLVLERVAHPALFAATTLVRTFLLHPPTEKQNLRVNLFRTKKRKERGRIAQHKRKKVQQHMRQPWSDKSNFADLNLPAVAALRRSDLVFLFSQPTPRCQRWQPLISVFGLVVMAFAYGAAGREFKSGLLVVIFFVTTVPLQSDKRFWPSGNGVCLWGRGSNPACWW
jgi:hypothetical protein